MKFKNGEVAKVRVIKGPDYNAEYDPPVGFETTVHGDDSTSPFIEWEDSEYSFWVPKGQYINEDNIELVQDSVPIPDLGTKEANKIIRDANKSSSDPIVKPSHYTQGKIEILDFLEDQKLDFRLSNVIKYVCRHAYKGKPLEDLKKARFYLDRVIKELESNE